MTQHRRDKSFLVLFSKKGLLALPILMHGTQSVRMRLVILGVAAIAPMLLLFIVASFLQYRVESVRTGERQLALTRSMAATVERELGVGLAGIKALALSPRLQVDDMKGFRNLAVRFMADEPAGSGLILLDRTGQHLVNTLVPLGGKLPHRAPAPNEELTKVVFETAKPMISNLFPRAPSGALIVAVDTPVLKDGHVIYDLSLVLPANRFQEILEAQRLPSGVVASIFDRNGASVARIPNGSAYIGRAAVPVLLQALLSQDEDVVHPLSREGIPLLAAFSHTQPSGWAVAMGVPEAQLRLPLLRSVALLLGIGLLGLLISTVVAILLGQRILQPIRALTRLAASPDLAPAGGLGLMEVDEVAAALRSSLRERQAAMAKLESLNDQLEARIRDETATRVQAQAQLAQSQRMEALGQLAGGIAHDFNNVLQAVTSGLSLIQRRADDGEAVRRLAEMAGNASARGASITGRLLAFARRGELTARPVEPVALLESLRDMLLHTLGAGIDVRVEASSTLPDLLADRAQLETVLVNLAVNARDAMPDGGVLTLVATAEMVDAGTIPGLAAGAYLHFILRDTGTGMRPEVLARASEPFFTTKEPGQGTGLGLAMARGFCQQSGGGFQLNSILGEGTTVRLWFPQARAERRDDDAAASPAPQDEDQGPMRLLLVDDDSIVREVMAGEMEARAFHVITAHDGRAALALLDSGHEIDLLITDYAMPAMNGLALIGEVRRRFPSLPALLLTGYAEASAEDALFAAADRLTLLLRKPIGGAELADRVRSLRRRKS